jgi:hypothetical protein
MSLFLISKSIGLVVDVHDISNADFVLSFCISLFTASSGKTVHDKTIHVHFSGLSIFVHVQSVHGKTTHVQFSSRRISTHVSVS